MRNGDVKRTFRHILSCKATVRTHGQEDRQTTFPARTDFWKQRVLIQQIYYIYHNMCSLGSWPDENRLLLMYSLFSLPLVSLNGKFSP
jgi:hypothetical protein